jgi:4-alpha-glucanotransferase
MIDGALEGLARKAGLATAWTDFRGARQNVSPDVLRAVLAAMGLAAGSKAEIADSAARFGRDHPNSAGALLTADPGGRVSIAGREGKARLFLEDGGVANVVMTADGSGRAAFDAPDQPGYHTLEVDARRITLAVAPKRGWTVEQASPGRRLWGLAAQLYGLRGGRTEGFGDFAALAHFAEQAAMAGADAVAVSPTHALFTADIGRYAPYAPSTRLFLNPLYANPAGREAKAPIDDGDGLIDWPAVARRKLATLRATYEAFRNDPADQRAAFAAFVAAGGESLLSHARFEALDARFRPHGIGHWRRWPDGFADASSAKTRSLGPADPTVEFHLFLQFIAERSLCDAQTRAREAGMVVGLISDIAVGMDSAGSHAWSHPGEILSGIGVGAPPDLLGPEGQNWGLTTFSPVGLRESGFAGFIAMLRAAMRNAGGVRIDHAMGLRRLWVIPDGATADQGTYLAYPIADLLRLLALESLRHRAVVIGEDLGTVPDGFREETTARGVLGMRVLWFERGDDGDFRPPGRWDAEALALTTTHDLPTVAGWWRGRDIDWREKTGATPERIAAERAQRAADKPRLWRTLLEAGITKGEAPPADQPERVVDGALELIAATPCRLAIAPVEDVLGLAEQPNLPGTIDTHPNWRRRLPCGDTLSRPDATRRLALLNQARRTG